MGTSNHTDQGKMLIGLSTAIRKRKSDINRTARWNYTSLVGVSRPEPRVYKVIYLIGEGRGERVEFLSTTQMSTMELQALREFVATGRSSDAPQFSPNPEESDVEPEEELPDAVEAKPKASGTVKLTGMEKLERKFQATEPPISEAIRDTALSVPEIKYHSVCVVKTYTVVREEVFVVKFTDKTLAEFRAMGNGGDDDQFVYNYLLRRQTDKLTPVSAHDASETKPTFVIKEKEE